VIIAQVAREAFERASRRVSKEPATEWSLKGWILQRLRAEGLHDADTTVACGPNSADPHYEPVAERHAAIEPERVLLIDLWARTDPMTVFADQTWMGYTGPRPPADVLDVWRAVRDARDRALAVLRERIAKGPRPRGCDVDRAARALLEERGYADTARVRTWTAWRPRTRGPSSPRSGSPWSRGCTSAAASASDRRSTSRSPRTASR
jgi:Xaa-Pro aminopeptidase